MKKKQYIKPDITRILLDYSISLVMMTSPHDPPPRGGGKGKNESSPFQSPFGEYQLSAFSDRTDLASQRQFAVGWQLQVCVAVQQALVPVSAHAQRIWSAGQTRRS